MLSLSNNPVRTGIFLAGLCAISLAAVYAQTGTLRRPTSPQPARGKTAPPAPRVSPTPSTAVPGSRVAVITRKAVPPAGAFGSGTLFCTLQSPFINESSGIVAGRRNPGVFWTHNDSGDGAYLYAFNRSGKTVGVFLARSAYAGDWEDIAAGPGVDGKGQYLYVGDIGDYGRSRTEPCLYRIPEPLLTAENRVGTKARPRLTDEPTRRLLYRYPDGSHDSEALLVHPQTGTIYLVTKEEKAEAAVYKFPAIKTADDPLIPYVLEKVGAITFNESGMHPFPNRVTGGDIAPDGKRLILRTYFAAYEWRLPDGEKKFDEVWSTTPAMVPLPLQPQGEGICYNATGTSLLVSSEKTPTAIYGLKAK